MREHGNNGLLRAGTFELRDVAPSKREITGLITTNTVDRYGEVVEPSGALLESYRKNPVVLLNHITWGLPIGKNLWIKTDGNGLLAKTRFADTGEGLDTFRLYDEGFMKAWSIGFLPVKWDDGQPQADGTGFRRRFTQWELLEYSAVTVPANPDAVSRALDFVESPRIREELEKNAGCNANAKEVLERLERQEREMEEMRSMIGRIEIASECRKLLRM